MKSNDQHEYQNSNLQDGSFLSNNINKESKFIFKARSRNNSHFISRQSIQIKSCQEQPCSNMSLENTQSWITNQNINPIIGSRKSHIQYSKQSRKSYFERQSVQVDYENSSTNHDQIQTSKQAYGRSQTDFLYDFGHSSQQSKRTQVYLTGRSSLGIPYIKLQAPVLAYLGPNKDEDLLRDQDQITNRKKYTIDRFRSTNSVQYNRGTQNNSIIQDNVQSRSQIPINSGKQITNTNNIVKSINQLKGNLNTQIKQVKRHQQKSQRTFRNLKKKVINCNHFEDMSQNFKLFFDDEKTLQYMQDLIERDEQNAREDDKQSKSKVNKNLPPRRNKLAYG